jgi:Flp pilus assembly protein TadB
MPEEAEVETKEMQDSIEEAQEKTAKRESDEKNASWIKYIGLSTAVLAVFAAVGALLSGGLVNEALINQVKASDSWNEYQSSKQKDHLYTITINSMLDSGDSAGPASASGKNQKDWAPESRSERVREYEAETAKERIKADSLKQKAEDLEKEAESQIHRHHRYANSVACIQVAIALGAIAALTHVRSVWFLSLATGVIGIAMFLSGFYN